MKINGAELAVEVDGAGPAVLLVHGLGGTSSFCQVQAEALAERRPGNPRGSRRSAAVVSG